jgi:hypothetical protein
MLSLVIINLVLTGLLLGREFTFSSLLDMPDLVLESVVLTLEHSFNARALAEHAVLPSFALFLKLGFEAFVLLAKFLLGALSFFINGLLSFVAELVTEIRDLLLVFFRKLFFF